jgi:transcription antitermination factor NusG
VEESVIHELKNRVQADGLIRLERREFRPGDRVLIQRGPFAGMVGRVEGEWDDQKRVAILLEALWSARVLIPGGEVEIEAA